MRPGDYAKHDFTSQRQERELPDANVFLPPGHLLIPDASLAIGAVVASSVVVTIFDPHEKRGGMCHYLFPKPAFHQAPTPFFGLPAILTLLKAMAGQSKRMAHFVVGIYGGATPTWASEEQRKLAQANVDIAKDVMERKGIIVSDMDMGGHRGRKLWFLSNTNELLIAKTDAIRREDWFPFLEACR